MYVVIIKKRKYNYNSTTIKGYKHKNLCFWFIILINKLKGNEVFYTKE